MEDEERFLRALGWVPDEEDPVPVLAEEEIADVRVKIILSKVHLSHSLSHSLSPHIPYPSPTYPYPSPTYPYPSPTYPSSFIQKL
jgi:hypothetical protein